MLNTVKNFTTNSAFQCKRKLFTNHQW